jgi:hypothetical protein
MTEHRVIRVLRAVLATTVIALLCGQQGFAQSATFQRGGYVRMKETQTTGLPLSGILLKVIAVGGDHIRVERRAPPQGTWPPLTQSAIYVNDVAVSGFPQYFMALAAFAPERVPQTVPEGRYYVMGAGYTSDGRVSPIRGMFAGTGLEAAP